MPGSHLRKEASDAITDRDSLDLVRQVVDELSSQLPLVKPLLHYDHDHPLRPFAAVPFHQALRELSQLHECSCYPSLDATAAHIRSGRIRPVDIAECLQLGFGDEGPVEETPLGSRYALRLRMLLTPELELASATPDWIDTLCDAHDETIAPIDTADLEQFSRWVTALGSSQRSTDRAILQSLPINLRRSSRSRPTSMLEWQQTWCATLRLLCQRAVTDWQPPYQANPARVRSTLIDAHQSLITSTLATFCRAFTDPGVATWRLPYRELGFYGAFMKLHATPKKTFSWMQPRWQQSLAGLARDHLNHAMTPQQSIVGFLQWAKLAEREVKPYLQSALNSIRGWAGLLHQYSQGNLPRPAALEQFEVIEFMAVLLTLDRAVLMDKYGDSVGKLALGSLSVARQREREKSKRPLKVAAREYWLYRMAREQHWTPMQLAPLSPLDWATIHHELNSFPVDQRQTVLQEAFENRFRDQWLTKLLTNVVDPLSDSVRTASNLRKRLPELGTCAIERARPRLQLLACVDPTEESYRRHLESTHTGIETFGVPGFFNVDMLFKPFDQVHATRQVPSNVRARHFVEETIYQANSTAHTQPHFQAHSQPRTKHQSPRSDNQRSDNQRVDAEHAAAAEPNMNVAWDSPKIRGYSADQMACIVSQLLADAGMLRSFARLVVVMGHESSSANNPFEAADNCSFCGKQSSRANVQSFVQMANDYRVRELLKQDQIDIPDDCQFLGALRNSCNESLEFIQLDRLPPSHADDFRQAVTCLEQAAGRNARERTERLLGRDIGSDARALAHCDDRMHGGATALPELGAAGNALCIIGPRAWTRALNLEGRAFLVSYDRQEDNAERSILARLMRLVVPVCARVNLDYYFSTVAPDTFGAGPKAALNIEALLGVATPGTNHVHRSDDDSPVIDLRAGDLRTGLPREMVMHHEPMRLLCLVDVAPENMLAIMTEHSSLGQLFLNRHVRLVIVENQNLYELQADGQFSLLSTRDPALNR